MIDVRVLGPLRLTASGGHDVAAMLRRSKRAALVAYLAAATPYGMHRRDKLVALFWPELDAGHARGALNQALYVVRRSLGEAAVAVRGDEEVGLNPRCVCVDVASFQAAVEERRHGDALALYQGDLLDGFFVSGSRPFEGWVDQERARLRALASDAAWSQAVHLAGEGDHVAAARFASRSADLAVGDEAMARRVMHFLDSLGDRTTALRTFETFARHAREELGVEPSHETRQLVDAIRASDAEAPTDVDVVVTRYPPAAQSARSVPGADGRGGSRQALRRVAVAAVLIAAVGAVAGHLLPTSDAKPLRIIVLPFRNIGTPANDEYAAALTDELSTRLALSPGLSVIGQQTARYFARSGATVRQIAERVDVDYVVEGSITWERVDDRIRLIVRPQLVQARNEAQQWASPFVDDADGAESFARLSAIAGRVAAEVASAVNVEEPRATRLPSASVEAYDDYVRARQVLSRGWAAHTRHAAIQMLERATQRDTSFALAWAWLSFAHTEAFWLNALGADHVPRARAAGQRALRLDPTLPDAHMAMGHFYYACCQAFDSSLSHLSSAHAGNPGDAQVVMFMGNVHKRRGNWREAAAHYHRAAAIDPMWRSPLLNLGQMLVWQRKYDEAERTLARALELDPQETFAYSYRTWVALLRDGDVASAAAILAEASRMSQGFDGMRLPFYVKLLQHDYVAAREAAQRNAPAGEAWDEWLSNPHLRRGLASRLLGAHDEAIADFDSAHVELEITLRQMPPELQLSRNIFESSMVVALAGLGRHDEARARIDAVMATDPGLVDALSGATVIQNVALAYVLLGDADAAITTLERLLDRPARFSGTLLRIDPLWQPLHTHPRFARLARRR